VGSVSIINSSSSAPADSDAMCWTVALLAEVATSLISSSFWFAVSAIRGAFFDSFLRFLRGADGGPEVLGWEV